MSSCRRLWHHESDLLTGLGKYGHVIEHLLIRLISEINIRESHIALKLSICNRSVSLMRVAPRPVVCLMRDFGYGTVRGYFRIYKRYIAVVDLRLSSISSKILRARTRHYNSIHLHCELIEVAHELLCHVEERHHYRYAESHSGQ